MIGTQIGSVHRQRQGTGLATVLDDDKALSTYKSVWALNEQRADAQAAERKAARQNAFAALKAAQPEYWWKHRAEIETEWQAIADEGARLINSGIENPIADVSSKTLDFRKRLARIQAMGKHSKQLESSWTKLKQDVDGQEEDYFDADSLKANVDFYTNHTLAEISEKGLLPPTLTKRRPFMDARKFWGERMDELSKAANGNEVSDESVRQFVMDSFANPAQKDELIRSYSAQIEMLTHESRKQLEQVERETGQPVAVQLAIRDAKAYKKQQAPLDVAKELADAGDRVTKGLDVRLSESPTARSKSVDKKDLDAGLTIQAEAMYDNDARWQSAIERELPQGAEEKDAEYRVRAINHLKEKIKPGVKISTEYEKKDTTGTGAERDASYTNFLRDINSSNIYVARRAAGYLYNLPFGNNLDVTKAEIVTRAEEESVTGGKFDPEFNDRILKLTLTTDLSDRAIKEELVGAKVGDVQDKEMKKEQVGAKVGDVQDSGDGGIKIVERQGKRVVYIPVGSSRSDALLQMAHDQQYKRTSSVYKSEPSKERLQDFEAAQTTPTQRAAMPNGGYLKNKK